MQVEVDNELYRGMDSHMGKKSSHSISVYGLNKCSHHFGDRSSSSFFLRRPAVRYFWRKLLQLMLASPVGVALCCTFPQGCIWQYGIQPPVALSRSKSGARAQSLEHWNQLTSVVTAIIISISHYLNSYNNLSLLYCCTIHPILPNPSCCLSTNQSISQLTNPSIHSFIHWSTLSIILNILFQNQLYPSTHSINRLIIHSNSDNQSVITTTSRFSFVWSLLTYYSLKK